MIEKASELPRVLHGKRDGDGISMLRALQQIHDLLVNYPNDDQDQELEDRIGASLDDVTMMIVAIR